MASPITSPGKFWELHRKLGECYELEMRRLSSKGRNKHMGAPSPMLRAETPTALSSSMREAFPGRQMSQEDSAGLLSRQDSPQMQRLHSPPPPASPLTYLEAEREETAPAGEPSGLEVSSSEHSQVRNHQEPLKCWQQLEKKSAHSTGKSGSRVRSVSLEASAAVRATRQPFVLSPVGHFRNLWDLAGILFLTFDAIILPLQFVNPEILPQSPITLIQLCYWSLDVVLSFFTGYMDKGDFITDRGALIRRYLRTWFVPDVAVTIVDVVLEFTGTGEDDPNNRASTRVLRMLRLFRVVRLGKLTRFASFLRDKFESEVAYTQFSLMLLVIGMCLLEHVIACGWFGIGQFSSWSKTWLREPDYEAATFELQYFDSLRWAFSRLGIGGTNIEAVNETEALYEAVVAVISILTFSTIISSMTSLVSTLQDKRMEETQQFGLLRRFLRVNSIPDGLAQRVTRFLHYTYHVRMANSDDPYILDFLSKSLSAELRVARYQEQLCRIQFFARVMRSDTLTFQDSQVVQRLAREALTLHDCAEDDVVFCQGQLASASYFMMQGDLNYQNEARAPPQHWVAEMCLWTVWQHSGDLLCTSFGKMLAMHVQEFCDIVCKSSSIRSAAHKYALSFVTALNLLPQLNDFSTPLLLETQTQRRSSLVSLPGATGRFLDYLKRPFRSTPVVPS